MNVRRWFRKAAVVALGEARPLPCLPRTRHEKKALLFLVTSTLAWAVAASAQQQAIDVRNSVMTVRVYKAGIFSAFGHDHEITAPIASGSADTATHHVELRVDASALRVSDSKASEKDRNEIQTTMLGPEVLDSEHHPEIVFRSTEVEPMGTGSWRVHGDLALHGQTRPVTVEVSQKDGHYIGNLLLKQTEFGIKPVRIAGGTVRVKNEIRIEFDIQLAR
jgi:polyisoprenoid-binding protein YceI